MNAKKAVLRASPNVDAAGRIWAAAQLLSSFLVKPTLERGNVLSFFHHFLFIKDGEKKKKKKEPTTKEPETYCYH